MLEEEGKTEWELVPRRCGGGDAAKVWHRSWVLDLGEPCRSCSSGGVTLPSKLGFLYCET